MELLITTNELNSLKCRDNVKLRCLHCQEEFIKTKHQVLNYIRLNSKQNTNQNGRFCSRICFGSYRKKQSFETNCKFCNSIILKSFFEKNANGNYFCNQSCSAKFFNGKRKVDNIKLECNNCKTLFHRKIYDISKDANRKFYCSKECFYQKKFILKKPVPKDNNGAPLPNTKCSNCNKSIFKYQSALNKNEYNFCNKTCQAIFANKNYNKKSRFGINRSKSEEVLIKMIKNDFPNLEII